MNLSVPENLNVLKLSTAFLSEKTTYTTPFAVLAASLIQIASPTAVFWIYNASFSTVVIKSDGVPSSWVKVVVGPIGVDVAPADFAAESAGSNVVPNGLVCNVSTTSLISVT